MILVEDEIEQLLTLAIEEDIGSGDRTTAACIPAESTCKGTITLKQAGIIAGLPFFQRIFHKIDPRVQLTFRTEEGSYQKSGTIIGTIEGPTQSIVSGLRTGLNLLQHVSGVATHTYEYVRKLEGYDCIIMDTRRTLPGLRALEKYAIARGGAVVHRQGLDDRLILKIDHLRFFGQTSEQPIKEAFQKLRSTYPTTLIDIEINDTDQLDQALETDAQGIILRNMFPHEIEECVTIIRKSQKNVYVNCGNIITLDTIRNFADTGVDGIFVGSLSHSANSLDIAIKLAV